MATNGATDGQFLAELTPTQDHFFKKYLIESQLSQELHYLSKPNCLEYLGYPFTIQKSKTDDAKIEESHDNELPLLRFFFANFIESFPFITNNPEKEQLAFWRDTVQPFVESFNQKNISDSLERKDQVTKRKQVNTKLLHGLLLFYNSMLVSEQDLQYLHQDHLKPSDTGKLDKLQKGSAAQTGGLPAFHQHKGLDDYASMKFVNDVNVNIIAVKKVRSNADVNDATDGRRASTSGVSLASGNSNVSASTSTTNNRSMSPSSSSSSWNPFKNVSIPLMSSSSTSSKGPRHHYEFVLQVTKRKRIKRGDNLESNATELKGKAGFTYDSHFISRPYHEFKKLESSLRKKYPGLMATDIPRLPVKLKHDDGVSSVDDSSGKSSPSTEGAQPNSFSGSNGERDVDTEEDAVLIEAPKKNTKSPTRVKLYREKLRLALRGYINTLVKHAEIVHSDIFDQFINEPLKIYDQLSPGEWQDYEERLGHERAIMTTQYEFQQQTSKVVFDLSQDFDKFKVKLINNPESLSEIFKELSESESIDQLSPLLRIFLEWCKLEVAATLYQVFLGQDNSSEWLIKCQKFHRLFPYNVIYGILRFTNPVKVVSRVIDLLLVNFPTMSWPSWPGSKADESEELKKASKKTGAKNLLSMMFVMLLNEDLSDYEKELTKLREGPYLKDGKFDKFLDRINQYVALENGDTIGEIKDEAIKNDDDLLLAILKSDKCDAKGIALNENDEAYQQVRASYEAYESLEIHHQVNNSELYLTLRQYWQILIRRRDKDIMKQLWQEPELTQLIKRFLTIFYQPLMKIFKKCDIHIVFKDFEKFMDDLMNQLGKLSDGEVFFMSSIEIFDLFKKILDKHEIVLWRFIHNLYVKDDQQLFIKLIKWIEKFLKLLRMKYVDESAVQIKLTQLIAETDEAIDTELFWTQLNFRIDKILLKRKLLKEYLKNEAQGVTSDDGTGQHNHDQDEMDAKWNDVNNDLFGKAEGRDFGIDARELEEFNLLQKHEDSMRSSSKTKVTPGKSSNTDNDEGDVDEEGAYHKLQRGLLYQKIAEIDKSMEELGTSELDKFDTSFKRQLQQLLGNLVL